MRKAHDELPEDNTALWEELKKRADRIEALESALRKIAEAHSIDGANAIARSALTPEQAK